jgi:hypothetical protein
MTWKTALIILLPVVWPLPFLIVQHLCGAPCGLPDPNKPHLIRYSNEGEMP